LTIKVMLASSNIEIIGYIYKYESNNKFQLQ